MCPSTVSSYFLSLKMANNEQEATHIHVLGEALMDL